MTESNRIEYKRQLTDSLEKEVVAFLNSQDGGVIYLGVDSDGVVVGVEDCDEVQLAVKDRLEIISAGGLPYGVSEEDFFNGYSSPRNKEIMRVFRDLEIVEQLGSGVPRILERYGRDVFEIRPNFLRVVFKFEQVLGDPALNEGDSGEKRGEKRGETLSLNRQQIIDAMLDDPFVTHVRLAEAVGIGTTNIEKNICYLKEHGWVRRV